MAIILGTCGCCGGACTSVTTNCNFVLRKFDNNQELYPEWNENATSEDIACFNYTRNGQGECPYMGGTTGNITFGGGMSPCTGEGIITRSVGYEGGSGGETETIGTFTQPYEDESIDFDNIGEIDLTDADYDSSTCKFSYNFTFTPEDGIDYYIIALPCDEATGYTNVSLAPDGRAYFNASYNGASKGCIINQTYVLEPPASDTNAPESQ